MLQQFHSTAKLFSLKKDWTWTADAQLHGQPSGLLSTNAPHKFTRSTDDVHSCLRACRGTFEGLGVFDEHKERGALLWASCDEKVMMGEDAQSSTQKCLSSLPSHYLEMGSFRCPNFRLRILTSIHEDRRSSSERVSKRTFSELWCHGPKITYSRR